MSSLQPTAKREDPRSGSAGIGITKRRAHRKSRKGCRECKRRHIKCDEARPCCINCMVTERSCSYPASAAAPTSAPMSVPSPIQQSPAAVVVGATVNNGSQAHSLTEGSDSSGVTNPRKGLSLCLVPEGSRAEMSAIYDHPIPLTLPSFCERFAASPTPSLADSLPQPTFTAKHLVLLHHAETAILSNNGFIRTIIDIAVTWATDAPYAMDQLLAFAACHLALQKPEDAVGHRRTATELQTRGLASFNREIQDHGCEDSTRTCLPRFLFASLLSIHILHETFAYYRTNFHSFIDRFVEGIHLHRGVRTVVQSTYNLILETPLRPFLTNVRKASSSEARGTECLELEKFIDSSDLPPAAVDACKSAAQSLQWAFNVHANLPTDDSVHAVTAFPVLLTADFVDTLRKHRSEAVLVLTYYGVLLHRCRGSWIIGDAGAFLIQVTADYLGSAWQELMRWPLEALKNEQP